MAKNLVIVESPAKAKTIGKMLGRNYKVLASVGHVRDLPKSRLGIDIEDNFEPGYINIRGKGPVINELKKEGKKAEKIYLATDPDREGEAISWHLAYLLDIDENEPSRVEFNEITKTAVKKAMKTPRKIDQDLVDAQQARRVLDRLVGYQISPLLWKKIKRGLSAGRVQSVATKMICDREEEINNFIPEEYWSIQALLNKNNKNFEANFFGERLENGKDEKVELKNEEQVKAIIDNLDLDNFVVDNVTKGSRKRNPYAPYTTSTLQQDASRRLNFTTKKTMSIAQQLYEGIDIKGEGTAGLITYMRTDSTRISDEAVEGAKSFILSRYGKEYSNGGRNYNKKGKSDSQDAHEAIRPTRFDKSPAEIKDSLTKDQYKLYELIWNRFLSSQMTPAVYDTLRVDMISNNYIFRSTGRTLVFPGFLKVYNIIDDNEKDMDMPNLEENDKVVVDKINPNQHFTQPPGRYTEASLIKTLEENGIGRPSTYAPTIGTILARNYVILENKTFVPTELGILVNELLVEYFGEVINEEFTAKLEDQLDEIAEGNSEWKEVVSDFYEDFYKYLKVAEEEIEVVEIEDEETDIPCEKCGRNMVIKMGRFGKFLACPGYPECKNTKTILDKVGVDCPECDGEIVRKKTKRGRNFYGCSNYPKCEFALWQEPSKEKCERCGSIMTIKRTKNKETLTCINKDCGFTKDIEK
ncbi:MAG TPA: type I DNA topoisomerase [Tissierellaceae bacterium]